MVDKQPRSSFLRRRPWVAPVAALALAVLSAGLGQVAQSQILAQPDQAITFIVEDDLPYGITQSAVDAVAATQAYSYESFTVMVVERDLTWDETENGVLPDGVDVMLSVGFNEDDIDVSLPDTRRVAIAKLAKLDDWRPQFRLASDVRDAYVNNLTQGHGASAVVGAGLTAAAGAFDGGTRSPVFWISIALLPLFAALLIMVLWARYLARERAYRRAFARARLRLARVVLELDLLEVRVLTAEAELESPRGATARKANRAVKTDLATELAVIRRDSLALAHDEQVLTREILNPRAAVHERGKPQEPLSLAAFTDATEKLWRRSNALVAASSLRVGHAPAGDVLGQIALATTLGLDEILKRRDRITSHEIKSVNRQRNDLLALVREAETTPDSAQNADATAAHADLIWRWQQVEKSLVTTLARIDRRLSKQVGTSQTTHINAKAIAARMRKRARMASGGALDTMTELRASLGLTGTDSRTPSQLAERVLLVIDALDGSASSKRTRTSPAAAGGDRDTVRGGVAGVTLLPIVAALIAGCIALATMAADDRTYGKTLTGADPLTSLSVVGDPDLLPDYADGKDEADRAPNIDTLTLDFVRNAMDRTASYPEGALLPEPIDLIVVLLPLDEYVEVHSDAESGDRVRIDYFDLLDAYPRIKAEVAADHPDVIDPISGDVRMGYAILPLWIADDGAYGVGLPLTGTLSTGVDSRLGAYDFVATEPHLFNEPGETDSLEAGWLVASRMSDLGRQLEYNNLRKQTLEPSALFWTVAIATWTAAQVLVMAAWSLAQLGRRYAGTRRARAELRDLRAALNKLALGLDLSMLDAVAVLGTTDGHNGRAAEADQRLYETMLLTAWRETQELESLPRREQRTNAWRDRVERLRVIIASLTERDTAIAERALALVRTYE